MGYELPYKKWVSIIKDPEAKKALMNISMPDDAFFGDTLYKAGTGINAKAKTTDTNVKYLSALFDAKIVGKDLDIFFTKTKIRFIISGLSAAVNRNALGKKLADAGELATVLALSKKIEAPEDTKQPIFINDVKAFKDWQLTFNLTPGAIKTILGSNPLSQYTILHDATDKTSFKDVIREFTSKVHLTKDAWSPADIYIIKTASIYNIVNTLSEIVSKYEASDDLIGSFNSKIYDYYKKKQLFPISLKQLVGPPSIEYNNEPGAMTIKINDIVIKNFNCDLSLTGKEIGLFTFTNKDTGRDISMQVRGFQHGYKTAQTEITRDGSPSGGRLGKVPTSIIDNIMQHWKFEPGRISSISYFGNVSEGTFSKFDKTKIDEVWNWYTTVIADRNVTANHVLTKSNFEGLVKQAKKDYKAAETLCIKIQGLCIMYFLIKNKEDISFIMNQMINGAKKLSINSCFFIKIY
jgi:hypothetical protein